MKRVPAGSPQGGQFAPDLSKTQPRRIAEVHTPAASQTHNAGQATQGTSHEEPRPSSSWSSSRLGGDSGTASDETTKRSAAQPSYTDLLMMEADPDPEARYAAAMHRDARPSMLDRLSRDEFEDIRVVVAVHPNTAPATLVRLAYTDNTQDFAAMEAVRRENFPEDALEPLFDPRSPHYDEDVHWAIMRRGAPLSLQTCLALRDKAPDPVCRALAENRLRLEHNVDT